MTVVAVVGSRGDGDGGEINFHHRGGPRGDGYWAKFSSKNFFGPKKFNFFEKNIFLLNFIQVNLILCSRIPERMEK